MRLVLPALLRLASVCVTASLMQSAASLSIHWQLKLLRASAMTVQPESHGDSGCPPLSDSDFQVLPVRIPLALAA